MIDWFFATLKQYPEIAIFLTLGIGYYFGKFTFKGIGLGSVTATLLAGVLIGQIGITIAQPLKATVFLMFLFAVGYGVGPQFVRGVAKDGCRRRSSRWSSACSACCPGRDREVRRLRPRLCGRTLFGVADDLRRDGPLHRRHQPDWACRRPGQGMIDSMPVAYAVTYMFGTMGSAIVIAMLGPKLLGINLVAACKDYEEKYSGGARNSAAPARPGAAGKCARFACEGGQAVGLRCRRGRGAGASTSRVFVCASAATARSRRRPRHRPREGDVLAVAGARDVLVECSARTRTRSTIRNCWPCRSRASMFW